MVLSGSGKNVRKSGDGQGGNTSGTRCAEGTDRGILSKMRYGIIGNCKTAALVHESGSIDWCCFPKFESPSLFAFLLDPKGGRFSVQSPQPCSVKQSYIPKTNILRTEFDDGNNAFATIDFMPRYQEDLVFRKPLEIHRILKPLKGKPVVR